MMNTDSGHISGESFVKPQVRPPFHGDQIAKPLMGQFMGHNGRYVNLCRCRREFGIVKQSCFPEKKSAILS